jgi:hypothetical protein
MEECVAVESAARRESLLRGTAESLAVIAAFLALGFGAALGESSPAPYPPASTVADAPAAGTLWIVDGFNVLHASVLRGKERSGWWRADVRERLLERVRSFEEPGAEIWVVFDGPNNPESPPAEGGPRVVFAPSADEWVLARIRAEADPARVAVVTADRRLAGRSQRRGVRVVPPREFLSRCGPA